MSRAWNALLVWLRETLAAKAQNVSLRRQLEAAWADIEQLDESLAESRTFGEMQAQKYQRAMESLARLSADRADAEARALTSQQAFERALADLDTARAQNEALRARLAALRASEAAREETERALREEIDAALNERYAAYELPVLSVTTVAKPLGWVASILEPLITEAVPGVKNSPVWLDGTYYLVPVETYLPLIEHWRRYLMLPFEPERADCDDRGISFREWAHRWSGGLFAPGLAIGTTPWALKDGEPYPHLYNLVVDPDGKVWVLDPALNPTATLWSDEIRLWTLIF